MPPSIFHRLPRKRPLPGWLAVGSCLLWLLTVRLLAAAEPDVPANLGRGLRPLVNEFVARRLAGKSEKESVREAVATSKYAQADAKGRVLVDVMLDGKARMNEVRRKCEIAGGNVTAAIDWYRHGVFSVWLPLREAANVAQMPGVSAVHLAPRRQLRIGLATSQGTVVHHTDKVNASGYLGAGITVGVLSDSYNDDEGDSSDPGWRTATDDVETGDLPGTGNPNGYTTPVNVIEDGDSPEFDTDEGRAMLQIVHDVAPAANLAFATAGDSDAEMAANIMALHSSAGCQIICDDTGFFDEPMFSDGVIAQAVDNVAAEGVAYFSAIGNDGNSGYQAVFNPVLPIEAQPQATAEGINLNSIPAGEKNAIYEWHAFGTDDNGNPIVVQNITTGGYQGIEFAFIFQWDDPFDVVNGGVKGITTDYDILVFNSAGKYISQLSGVDNNISTNEPIEIPPGSFSPDTAYKICIVQMTRTNGAQSPLATHLRYVITDDYDVITGDFIQPANVSAQGHPYAAGSAGVAAYDYDSAPDPGVSGHVYTPLVEGYSSNGPIDIYFDSAGDRLSTPITRKQPMFACADNVDTTFFPPSTKSTNSNDYDDDGFPNFAGTSAATPHAAGIAALMMNAAAVNNLGVLPPREIQALMIATTQGTIDENPLFSSGTAGPVTITDSGDGQIVENVFDVNYSGTASGALTNVTINLSPVAMRFDPSSTDTNGTPWTLVSTSGSPAPKATAAFSPSSSKTTMILLLSNFALGDTLSFTVGFDFSDTLNYGYDADELGGATISATVGGVVYTGTMANQLGRSYNYKAGFGLLDAQAAINLLLSQ